MYIEGAIPYLFLLMSYQLTFLNTKLLSVTNVKNKHKIWKISICFMPHAFGINPRITMHASFKQLTHLIIGLSDNFSLSVRLTWKTVPKHSEPDFSHMTRGETTYYLPRV